MEYSLTDAAHATGLSRPTIFRAIKNGKLSARRMEDRSYRIEASELARVYPLVSQKQNDETRRNDTRRAETHVTPRASEIELALLRLKVQMLEEQMRQEREFRGQERNVQDRERETFRETLDDLRRRLDTEQEERRALQRLLAPPPPEKPQDRQVEVPTGIELPKTAKGFLSRLWGR
jgi:excisionase family DNA binding protein